MASQQHWSPPQDVLASHLAFCEESLFGKPRQRADQPVHRVVVRIIATKVGNHALPWAPLLVPVRFEDLQVLVGGTVLPEGLEACEHGRSTSL